MRIQEVLGVRLWILAVCELSLPQSASSPKSYNLVVVNGGESIGGRGEIQSPVARDGSGGNETTSVKLGLDIVAALRGGTRLRD